MLFPAGGDGDPAVGGCDRCVAGATRVIPGLVVRKQPERRRKISGACDVESPDARACDRRGLCVRLA